MLQLGQRSLTASEADGDLFADRVTELAAVERALELGFNVYISGPAGSGKTSFLRQIEARHQSAAFLNLARVDKFENLLDRLAATINPKFNDISSVFHPARPIEDEWHRLLVDQGEDQLGGLRSALFSESSPPVMLLDNLDPALRLELFGRQRDELWELPLQWVVVGDAPLLDPPVNSFFETSIALEPFSEDAARELLVRRCRQGTPEQQVQMLEIADTLPRLLGPATPRRVIATARTVVLSADSESSLRRLRDQQNSHLKLSPTARRVLDALYGVGSAHAGDEQLLKQVGATRSRVVQVLKELEDAHLVRSVRDGKRKLYTPVVADDHPITEASA